MAKPALASCVAGGLSNSAWRAMERSAWTAPSASDGPFTTETQLESGGRLVKFPEDWHQRNGHLDSKPGRAPVFKKGWHAKS